MQLKALTLYSTVLIVWWSLVVHRAANSLGRIAHPLVGTELSSAWTHPFLILISILGLWLCLKVYVATCILDTCCYNLLPDLQCILQPAQPLLECSAAWVCYVMHGLCYAVLLFRPLVSVTGRLR